MTEIPIIDVSALSSTDSAIRDSCAATLGQACRETGFFYATGHGIPPGQLAALFTASRAFFALPDPVKQSFAILKIGNNRGYADLSTERLDPSGGIDRKEAFNIGLELPENDPHFTGANAWPDLPGWRALILDYFNACWALGRLLHRGFSLDLGVAEDFFEDKLDAPMATLRLLRYPPADAATEGALGAGEHTDYGNVTILAVEGVAGLQVRTRAGVWLDAPTVADAFVCNIGDCLMRWTNDIYVSTPHRVLVPQYERYSAAFFLDPNPDAVVTPIALSGSAKYAPITGGAYIAQRLKAAYQA